MLGDQARFGAIKEKRRNDRACEVENNRYCKHYTLRRGRSIPDESYTPGELLCVVLGKVQSGAMLAACLNMPYLPNFVFGFSDHGQVANFAKRWVPMLVSTIVSTFFIYRATVPTSTHY